jgi:hypothetical protein|tara:strand:+ start:928 stop:1188 length:261 start_codon:yes stop_codon:yes gene_type:complete
MSYLKNYDTINWTGGEEYISKNSRRRTKSLQVMSDIEEFVSPVDKSVISSRSGLRNHERRHGIRQIGNDWSGKEHTNSAKPDNWQQ